MSEDSGQEKTEEATDKRKLDVKKKGSVARSKELTTTLLLIASSTGIIYFGKSILIDLQLMLNKNFTIDISRFSEKHFMHNQLIDSFKDGLLAILPLFILIGVVAFIAPILSGGWIFSLSSISFKMEKLNPISGIGKIFSTKSLIELVKSIIKVATIIFFCGLLLSYWIGRFMELGTLEPILSIYRSLYLIFIGFILISCTLIIISIIDVPWQIISFINESKMTKQEVRDEMKETDGRPEVKSKLAQIRRQIAKRRMMSEIPTADVVLTNPTHFAVALKYDNSKMAAPILVAKGVDLVAQNIQKVAKAHRIPIIQSPMLARSVFYSTEIDDPIPEGLYKAIAQILAYVYQLKLFNKGKVKKPTLPKDFSIPDNLRR